MSIHRFPNTGADWSGLRAATMWLDDRIAKGQAARDAERRIIGGLPAVPDDVLLAECGRRGWKVSP